VIHIEEVVPGGGSPRTPLDNVKVDSVLVAMNIKAEYID
jgi:hypothetical protein